MTTTKAPKSMTLDNKADGKDDLREPNWIVIIRCKNEETAQEISHELESHGLSNTYLNYAGSALIDHDRKELAEERRWLADGYLNIQAHIQGEIDRIESGLATERTKEKNDFLATQLKLIIRQFNVVKAELSPNPSAALSTSTGENPSADSQGERT